MLRGFPIVGVINCPMNTSISDIIFVSTADVPNPSSRNPVSANDRKVFQCGNGAQRIPTAKVIMAKVFKFHPNQDLVVMLKLKYLLKCHSILLERNSDYSRLSTYLSMLQS